MKIRVALYKDGVPEALTFQNNASELAVEFHDMRFVSPIDVVGTVEKEEKSLRFHGDVSAQVVRTCGRTLAEVEMKWTAPFDWYFEIEDQEFIDPSTELRELIYLDHPMVYWAPGADQPVEYSDLEETKPSPFEQLKKEALGAAQAKRIKKDVLSKTQSNKNDKKIKKEEK